MKLLFVVFFSVVTIGCPKSGPAPDPDEIAVEMIRA